MSQVEVPYRNGYDLGIGVTLASGSPMQLGVRGNIDEVEIAGGGAGSFSLTEITSTNELEDRLGISAAASGSVGLFSISARFNFSRAAKYTETAILLLLHATYEFGFKQFNQPVLTTEALAEVGDEKLFRERYGDSFVRGMVTGGQFFGLIKIETRSSEEKRDIKGQLAGAYGTFKVDGSMDLISITKSKSSSIQIYQFHEGGEVPTLPRTPEELFTNAQIWKNSLEQKENRRPYQVTLAPYVIAQGPAMTSIELQHQRDVLRMCANARSRTLDALNLVDYMMSPEHQIEFIPNPHGPQVDLPALRASLSNDLDIIAAAASYAMDYPEKAKSVEAYAREERQLANYVLTTLPANMPLHEGLISVPNFIGQEWIIDVEKLPPPAGVAVSCGWKYGAGKQLKDKLESEGKLNFNVMINGINDDPVHIVDQTPPAGTLVPRGTSVLLTTTYSERLKRKMINCAGF